MANANYRTSKSGQNNNAKTIDVVLPSQVVANDGIAVTLYWSSPNGETIQSAPDATWIADSHGVQRNGALSSMTYYHLGTSSGQGSANSTATFTFTALTKAVYTLEVASTVDASNPAALSFIHKSAVALETVSQKTHTAPVVNDTIAGTWGFVVCGDRAATTTAVWTQPNGYAMRQSVEYTPGGTSVGAPTAMLADPNAALGTGNFGGVVCAADQPDSKAISWTITFAPAVNTPTPPPPPPANSVKLIAVGDIGGQNTSAVPNLVGNYYNDTSTDHCITVGDNVYEGNMTTDWSNFKLNPYVTRGGAQWIFPGTGHHDWGDSGVAGEATGSTVHSPADGLQPYFQSKGANLTTGAASNGMWSYYRDFADAKWRIIALSGSTNAGPHIVTAHNQPLVPNTNGTALYAWFQARLQEAIALGYSVLVHWSDPYYATTDDHHTAEPTMKPFWDLLYTMMPNQAFVLNSHKHNYERFSRMDNVGNLDTAKGIRQFVVGMGGESHYLFGTNPAATGSAFRDDSHYGVLELVLSPSNVAYRFINAADGTALDSGTFTLAAPAPPPPPPAPTATTVYPGADIVVAGWQLIGGDGTHLYSAIDDPSLDTTDYIRCTVPDGSHPATFRLVPALATPVTTTLSVPVSYRAPLAASLSMKVELLQGPGIGNTGAGTVIGGPYYLTTSSTDWVTEPVTFTVGEAGAITDGSDVWIRFTPTAA